MNNRTYTLNTLSIGNKAVVNNLTSDCSHKRRMNDLGLAPGTEVKALHRSPAGDPTAYYIMGTVIALRADDAKNIIIQNI